MVPRFQADRKVTRHRGCQTATVYVEPTRLLSTEHLARLSRWPVSFLHARALELNLANQPCPARSQGRHSSREQALCRAQAYPSLFMQQYLPCHLKESASIRPCKRCEQPPWDSSISWTCGHSPSTSRREQPQEQYIKQITPEVTVSDEDSCQVSANTAVPQLGPTCEQSKQTSLCLDIGSQTELTLLSQMSKEQPVKQKRAVLVNHNTKQCFQQSNGCCCCCRCCCCAPPRGFGVAGSRLPTTLPANTRPAWRCSSLKPHRRWTSGTGASKRPCYQVCLAALCKTSGLCPTWCLCPVSLSESFLLHVCRPAGQHAQAVVRPLLDMHRNQGVLQVHALGAHSSRVVFRIAVVAVNSLPPRQSRPHMAGTSGIEAPQAFSRHFGLQQPLSRR